MSSSQPGILDALPAHSRYLTFVLQPGADPRPGLSALAARSHGEDLVVGLGAALVRALDVELPGLRVHPHMVGPGLEMPATEGALWCWLRGGDRGELVHADLALRGELDEAFELVDVTDGFAYREGRDLSGYVDGTENPVDEAAREVAILAGAGAGMDGSSFVAVQQWVHDLERFLAMDPEERDLVIGRRISDNEEIDDAPESAHVKRTAQEDFEPQAFLVRRSMPWADGRGEGLVFVAFGRSFDAFEAQVKRMTGGEDGVVDALFRFTRPITGSYYWCPPVADGKLDLRALGL